MAVFRRIIRNHHRQMLAFVLFALGMGALVPPGMMIALSADNLFSLTLCPDTHPLARALAESAATPGMSDHDAAMHAAMGHGPPDESDAAPRSGEDCPFSLLTCPALMPGDGGLLIAKQVPTQSAPGALHPFALARRDHLRPPLRAPPVPA